MTRRTFDFADEPRGEELRALVHALAAYARTIGLVIRDGFQIHRSAESVISQLEPYLAQKTRDASWPGTVLLSGVATIVRFDVCEATLGIIGAAADGLYDWQQPSLPEDLSLHRFDGEAILGSIAHERDAFLKVTDEEFDDLAALVPGLRRFATQRA